MTRVCLVGDAEVTLRYELLSRETSRDALATYDLREPYENTVGLDTVSLGAAVSLLNDLEWYLVRFVDEALVLEPSVSDDEWLSRSLARNIRNDDADPGAASRFLKVYGVERPEQAEGEPSADQSGTTPDGSGAGGTAGAGDGERPVGTERPPRLVEPMLVARTGGTIPEYDLRDVDDTLVVRVTEREFDA